MHHDGLLRLEEFCAILVICEISLCGSFGSSSVGNWSGHSVSSTVVLLLFYTFLLIVADIEVKMERSHRVISDLK